MHAGQEVVLLIVQHVVREGHTRGHQLCDTSLHQFLRQLGVFQLVADGHAFASTNQLRQIGVKRMMGKASHLVALAPCPIVTMGQRDTQNARGRNGILTVGLIEVATPEQHHCIRMFRLQIEKLFHHWGQFPIFLCHYF